MVLWHKCSPVNSYGPRGNPSSAIPSLRPRPRTFKPDLLPIHHHDSPHYPFPDIHLFFATISGLHLHDNSFCTGQMLFCIILKVSRDSGCADRWISCTNNNATFSRPLLSYRNIFPCLVGVILATSSISSSTCITSLHRHDKITIDPPDGYLHHHTPNRNTSASWISFMEAVSNVYQIERGCHPCVLCGSACDVPADVPTCWSFDGDRVKTAGHRRDRENLGRSGWAGSGQGNR
jgi:hypothetical protein